MIYKSDKNQIYLIYNSDISDFSSNYNELYLIYKSDKNQIYLIYNSDISDFSAITAPYRRLKKQLKTSLKVPKRCLEGPVKNSDKRMYF